MNTLRNRVQLIGNLGKDPEVKEFAGGKKMARFSIATTESYENNSGEKVKETQWHNLVAWGKTASIAANHLTKGKEVAVEGKLTTRTYEDKDGHKKFISEVVVSEILLLGSKK
ncbi:MAG: single-stranded DNA-binding protein [Bacteroidales bacterium]|nr:single-stranded DNA-binding protein [Bacteroidales bacterium]